MIDADSLIFGFQLEQSELVGADFFKLDDYVKILSTLSPSRECVDPCCHLDADLDKFLEVLMEETSSTPVFPESTIHSESEAMSHATIKGNSSFRSSSKDSVVDLAFLSTDDEEVFNGGSPRQINRSIIDIYSDESDKEPPTKRMKTYARAVTPTTRKSGNKKRSTPVTNGIAASSITPRQHVTQLEDYEYTFPGSLHDDFESAAKGLSPAVVPTVPLLRCYFVPDRKTRRRRNFPPTIKGCREFAIALLRDRSKPHINRDNYAPTIEYFKGLIEIASKKRKIAPRSIPGLNDEIRTTLATLTGCAITAEIAPLASSGPVFFGRFAIKGIKKNKKSKTVIELSGLTRCTVEDGVVIKAVVTLDAQHSNS